MRRHKSRLIPHYNTRPCKEIAGRWRSPDAGFGVELQIVRDVVSKPTVQIVLDFLAW